MKQFDKQTNSAMSQQECAGRLMETVPLVMRTLRQEIRGHRPGDLSVPQFRVLAFLRRNEEATLSEAADHIGLTRPTMSKMVDGLVQRGWVTRDVNSHDRRCVRLRLTREGMSLINTAREATCRKMADRLEALAPEDRGIIGRALEILGSVFAPVGKAGQRP